jgi:protocatechuate 4,5-dioxygenase, alpha chain
VKPQEKTPMARERHEYDDIPGTYVFDAERSREGYGINMFCMSLMQEANRQAFKADEAAYLKKFKLTPEQTDAILKRDYNRMLALGGNIYFTAKLGATDGHSFQHLAAVMTGNTQDDYAKMMLGGGRSVEGNRSRSGKNKPASLIAGGAGKKSASAKSAKAKAPVAKASGKTKLQAKSATKSAAKNVAKNVAKSATKSKAKSKSPSKSAKRK